QLVLVQELVLPQHAQPRRLRDRDHALVGLDVAAQDAQQRRLARPVRAHQTVALARVELERRAREENLAAVTLGDVGYRDHAGIITRRRANGGRRRPLPRVGEAGYRHRHAATDGALPALLTPARSTASSSPSCRRTSTRRPC